MAHGAIVFAKNNNDLLPNAEEWPDALVKSGIIELENLVSRVEDGDGISFIYLPSHQNLFKDSSENRIIIYENPKHFKDGVVVGFADAHVEVIRHNVFEQMLADQLAAQTTDP
ncbi:MAG: hypothetical protein AB8C13_08325 [Phycisphaerales bacterium]